MSPVERPAPMHHVRAAHEIRILGVSKSLVATLAGLHRPDFIAWTNGKAKLSPAKIERLAEAITAIKEIVATSEQLGISFDLKNAANVINIIDTAKRLKADAALQDAQSYLDKALGEAAAIFSLDLT